MMPAPPADGQHAVAEHELGHIPPLLAADGLAPAQALSDAPADALGPGTVAAAPADASEGPAGTTSKSRTDAVAPKPQHLSAAPPGDSVPGHAPPRALASRPPRRAAAEAARTSRPGRGGGGEARTESGTKAAATASLSAPPREQPRRSGRRPLVPEEFIDKEGSYRSVIECGISQGPGGERVYEKLFSFFDRDVLVFVAENDIERRPLVKAGDLAAACNCANNTLAMFLNRRKVQKGIGIYQALGFKYRTLLHSALKNGGYFVCLEVCEDFSQHCARENSTMLRGPPRASARRRSSPKRARSEVAESAPRRGSSRAIRGDTQRESSDEQEDTDGMADARGGSARAKGAHRRVGRSSQSSRGVNDNGVAETRGGRVEGRDAEAGSEDDEDGDEEDQGSEDEGEEEGEDEEVDDDDEPEEGRAKPQPGGDNGSAAEDAERKRKTPLGAGRGSGSTRGDPSLAQVRPVANAAASMLPPPSARSESLRPAAKPDEDSPPLEHQEKAAARHVSEAAADAAQLKVDSSGPLPHTRAAPPSAATVAVLAAISAARQVRGNELAPLPSPPPMAPFYSPQYSSASTLSQGFSPAGIPASTLPFFSPALSSGMGVQVMAHSAGQQQQSPPPQQQQQPQPPAGSLQLAMSQSYLAPGIATQQAAALVQLERQRLFQQLQEQCQQQQRLLMHHHLVQQQLQQQQQHQQRQHLQRQQQQQSAQPPFGSTSPPSFGLHPQQVQGTALPSGLLATLPLPPFAAPAAAGSSSAAEQAMFALMAGVGSPSPFFSPAFGPYTSPLPSAGAAASPAFAPRPPRHGPP